jgi:ethanolamine utilization protein EutN
MKLAQVIGTLVATRKIAHMDGVKLLIVQALDKTGAPLGEPVVAADATGQAGPGERVILIASREAAQALERSFVPVDHAIVGIVDQVGE